MTTRVLLGTAGVALAVSLFLPWFDGVSGWEHWAWADVPLALLGVALLAAAAFPSPAPLRIAVAVLCGLGVTVVLGHGFAPDEPTREARDVAAGGYVALAALAAGVVGALAAWPRRGGGVLLVAGAAGIVGALLSGWGHESLALTRGGWTVYAYSSASPDGFARWQVLDLALLVLAAGLLVAAVRPLPRLARAGLGVASLAAAACVAIGVRDQFWVDEGVAVGAAKGPVVALLALAAAVAGLVLVRPRERAARAG